MRNILLLITVVICFGSQVAKSQEISLSDGIPQLSDDEMKTVFFSYERDTLGFCVLTSETSLDKYKGKKNRHIMRTMKSIKRTVDHYCIYNEIAGVRISSFLEKGKPWGGTHSLSYPKYKIMEKGIVLVGERKYIAPWNDIVADWKTLDYYFIGFDKSVDLVRSVHIDLRPKIRPIGLIEFSPESIIYNYLDSISKDSTMKCIPPIFPGGVEELRKFILAEIRYPESAIESGIVGKVVVGFIVDTDKSIARIRILRGVDPVLNEEVIRIVKKMNGWWWKAGTIDGKEIPVELILPVTFKFRD
ncbi:energy transducer TonB [Dysgonomonas sp. 520]|uniref:energy transducer TonB n=1 Tax=Dysgonomonas sp. 520 TaxID=2302931 RepID=UPI0013D03093|nr:energy transducer TonB [Dysgonomonas sp. 520]NDW10111.1 energy transducer TonB [Dysgonomonas sp. 520]